MLPTFSSRRRWLFVLLPSAFCLLPSSAPAAGLYQDGAGARAKAMGGAGAAVADDPLSALFDNPAALGGLDRCQLPGRRRRRVRARHLPQPRQPPRHRRHRRRPSARSPPACRSDPCGWRSASTRTWRCEARWHYQDAPGGADGATSYGFQPNQSEILLFRTAFGRRLAGHAARSPSARTSACSTTKTSSRPLRFPETADLAHRQDAARPPDGRLRGQRPVRAALAAVARTGRSAWRTRPRRGSRRTARRAATRACNWPTSAWARRGRISATARRSSTRSPARSAPGWRGRRGRG